MNELHTKLKKIADLLEKESAKTDELYDLQTVGAVSKTALDAAYREGVDSVGA
ncbi:MAG: hypothetical protein Q4C56_04130 [Peptococcaceae bacterium]|nr:hypothetical protein [Peptococcaceae bacterium]